MSVPGRHRRFDGDPDDGPAGEPDAAGPPLDEPDLASPPLEEPDEPGEPAKPQSGAGATRRGRRPRLLSGVLVLLVLAAGATDAWKVTHRPSTGRAAVLAADGTYQAGSQTDGDAGHALAAAVNAAPLLLSYDYRALPADLARALTVLTPTFRTTYQQTFTTSVVPVATSNMAVVASLVRGAGVVTADASTATVLLFVDQTLVQTTGANASTPTVNQDRVTITLARQGGVWLVDNVSPF